MQNPFFTGPTVYLRPVEKADAPTLTLWFNHFDGTRFMGALRPMSLAAQEALVAGMNDNPMAVQMAIRVRETDRLIDSAECHGMVCAL